MQQLKLHMDAINMQMLLLILSQTLLSNATSSNISTSDGAWIAAATHWLFPRVAGLRRRCRAAVRVCHQLG